MSILIVGSNGSMGKRYQCILKYLGRPFECVDIDHAEDHVMDQAKHSSGIIIATPTDTHVQMIRKFLPYRKPILCEKPVTKDVFELKSLIEEIRESKTHFRMMLQYELLDLPHASGQSRYNFFRHGNDGLVWDCLQVIGLARKEVSVSEESPIWSCMLNGKALKISHMDAAYIGYIQKWLMHPGDSLEKIYQMHAKTAEFKNGFY